MLPLWWKFTKDEKSNLNITTVEMTLQKMVVQNVLTKIPFDEVVMLLDKFNQSFGESEAFEEISLIDHWEN